MKSILFIIFNLAGFFSQAESQIKPIHRPCVIDGYYRLQVVHGLNGPEFLKGQVQTRKGNYFVSWRIDEVTSPSSYFVSGLLMGEIVNLKLTYWPPESLTLTGYVGNQHIYWSGSHDSLNGFENCW